MTIAHIHAALMAEYAKDAAETDKPWERWQFKLSDSGKWIGASAELAFSPKLNYQRKRAAQQHVPMKAASDADQVIYKAMAQNYLAPQPDMPDGWQLVPKEPNKTMIDNACKEHGYPCGDRTIYAKGYRSMLAAAPKPNK